MKIVTDKQQGPLIPHLIIAAIAGAISCSMQIFLVRDYQPDQSIKFEADDINILLFYKHNSSPLWPNQLFILY